MKFVFVILGFLTTVSCSENMDNSDEATEIGKQPKNERIELPETISIELFSEQFKWTARYAGQDNILGKFDYKLTTSANPLALMTTETIDAALFEMTFGDEGILALKNLLERPETRIYAEERELTIEELSRKERMHRLLLQMKRRHDNSVDANAMDDFILTDTLVLCLDKQYEFQFRSKDVIHAAYFPHFRAPMNTVPGMGTRFKYTPKITTKQMRKEKNDFNFEYVLMCNKICGAGHYEMKMIVRVLEQEAYIQWLKKKQSSNFKKAILDMKRKAKKRLFEKDAASR